METKTEMNTTDKVYKEQMEKNKGDIQNGYGTKTFDHGLYYEGEFEGSKKFAYGEPVGKGIVTFPDGTKEERDFG